jgi:undecaprenyl-phosphate galactose phosphotransferase
MIGWMGSVQGHYTATRRKPWWDEARQMVTVVMIAAMADAVLMYLGKWQFSRLWTGVTWLLILGALPLARLSVRNRLLKAGLLAQPYVMIGRPEDLEHAATALASERFLGYTPVAVVCPEPGERVTELGPTPWPPLRSRPPCASCSPSLALTRSWP